MARERESVPFDVLVPELRLWNNGAGVSIDTWLQGMGSFELAVAYAELFWPRLALHEDCVFFADFDPETVANWSNHLKGDKGAVERVVNHRHIVDLFPAVKEPPTREILIHLGRILRDAWAAKLRLDFPDRSFVVFFQEEDCLDLGDFQVTFFAERPAAVPTHR